MGKNKINYPFVYIASLMRTGSTVVQESLTELPYSFIFHEPQLCRNKFNIKDRYLTDLKFDIKKIMPQPNIKIFTKQIIPKLKKDIQQIGVKEIEHTGWDKYIKYIPNTKIILTGRHPKDIYISIYYWFARKKTNKWKDGRILTPTVLCESLMKDFRIQQQMRVEHKAIKIRYEDFCLHTEDMIQIMKKHIDSPIPNIGMAGGFLSNNPKRIGEYKIHGEDVTSNRVCRWKKEQNDQLVKQANEFYELMKEYRDFWGY